jgi:hypothetical protein
LLLPNPRGLSPYPPLATSPPWCAATPPPPPLTAAIAIPRGPSTFGPTSFRCGPIPGGGDIQHPLSSAMLVGALPYGLPWLQVGLTFALSLTHLPSAAWTSWRTLDTLTHGLQPQQAALTFASPLEHPPQVVWTASSALPYGFLPQQVDPTFVPPLAPPPSTSWPPWMSFWNQ